MKTRPRLSVDLRSPYYNRKIYNKKKRAYQSNFPVGLRLQMKCAKGMSNLTFDEKMFIEWLEKF